MSLNDTSTDSHEGSHPAHAGLALVVDDDAMLRRLMTKALSRQGFQTIEACDGCEALEIVNTNLDTQLPDIILMDVEMPRMNGFNACRAIRKTLSDVHLPILMVTGNGDEESVDRAYQAGATDFINKPVTFSLLGHRVRYLLRTSRAMGKLADTVKALDKNRDELARAHEIARLGTWEIDGTQRQMTCSRELLTILGIEANPIENSITTFLDLVHPEDRTEVSRWLDSVIDGGNRNGITHRIVSTAETRYLQQYVSDRIDQDSQSIFGIVQDITQQQQSQNRIQQLAYYDSLTGLPNRAQFRQRTEQAIERARVNNQKIAVMFLDIDEFKRVNDTLGHGVGDELLRTIAKRLQNTVRAGDFVTDNAEDNKTEPRDSWSLARFGGDEFTILLNDLENTDITVEVAARVRENLNTSMSLAGHEITVSPSIGIAHYPDDGEDIDTLLKNADTAMYAAKRSGKNQYCLYQSPMNDSAVNLLTMENALRKAVANNELQLLYQPQMHLESGRIIGTEALLRWQSPTLGAVSPEDFIPIAEQNGSIIEIGEWVLRTACQQMASWHANGLLLPRMAVNISARQFMDKNFADLVTSVLTETTLEARYLELEITETLLMQDIEQAANTLQSLKTIGVDLAIDDFGTGYSSLSYLNRFPIDRLKIDKSFIENILDSTEDEAITRAVVAMAQSMKLDVIAEGVETREQLQLLKSLDCSEIQGYYLSRPLPASDMKTYLSGLDTKAA